MLASALEAADIDWVVEVLTRRRDRLVEMAPVFWRPAADASARHREFIEYLLTEAGARGFRTGDVVLVAASRGDGWLVDDMHGFTAAIARAPALGCPVVVVNQVAGDESLAQALDCADFRRHCDFYTRIISPV